jgi:hypothetical protein
MGTAACCRPVRQVPSSVAGGVLLLGACAAGLRRGIRCSPGVARGAVVTVRGATRAMGKSCAIYLRAADATQFYVDTAPRCDWAESALAGGSVPPAHHIRALHAAAPDLIDRRQLRLRVRGARVHACAGVHHAALGLTMPPHGIMGIGHDDRCPLSTSCAWSCVGPARIAVATWQRCACTWSLPHQHAYLRERCLQS